MFAFPSSFANVHESSGAAGLFWQSCKTAFSHLAKSPAVETMLLIVSFDVVLTASGQSAVASLKTTFDSKVAPVRFFRTEFGKRPQYWINTEILPFPTERIGEL